MQFFGSLQLLMALLGLSWSLLGGSGPKRGFQNDLKSLVKSDQKVVQKMIKKGGLEGSKMGSKSFINRDRRAKAFSTMS